MIPNHKKASNILTYALHMRKVEELTSRSSYLSFRQNDAITLIASIRLQQNFTNI